MVGGNQPISHSATSVQTSAKAVSIVPWGKVKTDVYGENMDVRWVGLHLLFKKALVDVKSWKASLYDKFVSKLDRFKTINVGMIRLTTSRSSRLPRVGAGSRWSRRWTHSLTSPSQPFRKKNHILIRCLPSPPKGEDRSKFLTNTHKIWWRHDTQLYDI